MLADRLSPIVDSSRVVDPSRPDSDWRVEGNIEEIFRNDYKKG